MFSLLLRIGRARELKERPMRISTAWGQHTTLSAMLNQQSRLNYTQQQLASGIKNITPSDDPVSAKKVLDLNQGIERTEQYMRNV